jgi:acetoin:2,6-dichlorophenolindophenol oxidoreductase subunit alpha
MNPDRTSTPSQLTDTPDVNLHQIMYRIRRFEETVLENFPRGLFFGTTHTYLGQEANAAGVLSHLRTQDIVFSNHRCHGHFLAYGGDARGLFAELMGKVTGVCGGRGGSQHLHWHNFYSNGIQGGIIPTAVGMALAEKQKVSGAVTVVFLGDGTFGEGVVYEALNMASLWQAPVLFVVENNRIAQTTPIEMALAGSLSGRFAAFNIPVIEQDTSDVRQIHQISGDIFHSIRKTGFPHALILHTNRFGPHSKGDDTRQPEEIKQMRQERDPLSIQGARLEQLIRKELETAIDHAIQEAFSLALTDPLPEFI